VDVAWVLVLTDPVVGVCVADTASVVPVAEGVTAVVGVGSLNVGVGEGVGAGCGVTVGVRVGVTVASGVTVGVRASVG